MTAPMSAMEATLREVANLESEVHNLRTRLASIQATSDMLMVELNRERELNVQRQEENQRLQNFAVELVTRLHVARELIDKALSDAEKAALKPIEPIATAEEKVKKVLKILDEDLAPKPVITAPPMDQTIPPFCEIRNGDEVWFVPQPEWNGNMLKKQYGRISGFLPGYNTSDCYGLTYPHWRQKPPVRVQKKMLVRHQQRLTRIESTHDHVQPQPT